LPAYARSGVGMITFTAIRIPPLGLCCRYPTVKQRIRIGGTL
jgi:hypothetical protein